LEIYNNNNNNNNNNINTNNHSLDIHPKTSSSFAEMGCCGKLNHSEDSTDTTNNIGGVDFVAFSFYKMFGYPTGVGVLIVKNGGYKEH
jgi:hypothetical protein